MRDLIIIIDEEAKKSGRATLGRWFYGAKGTEGEYKIETPIGGIRTVKGTLVDKFNLGEMTSEYFYLDLTNECSYRCKHCGVKNEIKATRIEKTPVRRNAKYITNQFISAVASAISKYPWEVGDRNLFYGGGEPLINPSKFAKINHAFNHAEKTKRIVVTNGLTLPIQKKEFLKLVDKMGRPYIMMTYSESHARQYAALAKRKKNKLSRWIPDIEPDQALAEKGKILSKVCKEHGLGFKINLVSPPGTDPPQELRELILKKAIFPTVMDGHRNPCSTGSETSIRFNGDIYPHCYDVFSKKNKLGVIGFLREPYSAMFSDLSFKIQSLA